MLLLVQIKATNDSNKIKTMSGKYRTYLITTIKSPKH